jgi:hypothetical protein
LVTDLEVFLSATDRLNDLAKSRREVGNDIGEIAEVEGGLALTQWDTRKRSLDEWIGSNGSKSLAESIEAW